MPVQLQPAVGSGPGPGSAASGSSLPATGADVLDAASGRSAGEVRGALPPAGTAGEGQRALGLAYLRLDVALAAAGGGGELRTTGPDGVVWGVVPVRPAWWLPEWGHEETGAAAGGKGE
jgi:hypothetical protein